MIPYPELLRMVTALEELARQKRLEVRTLQIFSASIVVLAAIAIAIYLVEWVYRSLGVLP